eukprot:CAMPEP_0196198564 /NCGR_PEP_ID=MMETSP0912-20130531/2554_1 /TAXON_ID=49265 /ORGANISM="Thalassiosira rotula, Strain GSO102" /LENGTH=205 /DNA_ID=CAMNT_0041471581 /DNA_START=66 /DNA_END=683 /DNA_ORIENTATION=+
MTWSHRLPTAAFIGIAALSLSSIPSTTGFVAPSTTGNVPQCMSPPPTKTTTTSSALNMADVATTNSNTDEPFELMLALPGEGLSAQMKFPSIVEGPSEIVEVRYKLPFGLDVAPKDQKCVCTKDGAGGEKVGDILRYTSQWTLGLPRGDGVITTAMSFSGGISWQVSMFDVMRAGKWEDVIEALVSNSPDRTDEVVMLFERPLAE